MTRAAEAFEEALHELGLEGAELEEEQFGRRAALLAAAEYLWGRELGPMASSTQARGLLGCSRQALNERVHRGTILALAGPSGHVFPLFQFDETGQPVRGIADVVRALSDDVETPQTIAAWLVAPEPELDGEAPIEVLKSGETDRVLAAATHYAARLHE